MSDTADLVVPVRRISSRGEHCFFGYYDIPAADAAGRHLCHRVRFRDRFPTPDDAAILGWMPLPHCADDPQTEIPFECFAETRAWNFQQGAMLQWLSSEPDTCLYNIFEGGQFGACRHNVRTGTRRRFPLPVANVSQDGTKALGINMARLFDFRPGYGYEDAPDPFTDVAAPNDDGIFLMDLITGDVRLSVSLAEIVDFLEKSGEKIAGHKVLVNHVTFNPSATRYLFLLRTFPKAPGAAWATFLLTADTAGGGLRNHPVWGLASHYHWRDDDGMLFYANATGADGLELMLISDGTDERRIIDRSFFRQDGHCSYSRDRRWILYDSYPDQDTMRPLQIYSLDRGEGFTLGRFRSESTTSKTTDLRCDLHPRWMPDDLSITFDSIHEGYRGVYWVDLRAIVGN
ncbi:MAG: hypothetical protein KKG09_05710 [Verrucomicrobia bacterium]|nr:hypothetical protein [Verrucomicrobiota bacterium]MCG2681077.1 hypothetical protein [Kiritimatiellia bacterium]MBU4248306.1 hypothetical protein [Verrucomicrobiota bacterium]MBU4290500.1 hypothetical protein [Verrucomicrobiota bacterium]MBU4427883.1 hypothetical protein [Verrucomicrobiota bacterium]